MIELDSLYASGEGVLGTYISGSASYGGMTEYSDVDYYVLTRDHHAMTERILGSTKVEIRWRTENEISLDIARGGPFIYQMMDATVCTDPRDVISTLQHDARERYEAFKTSPETYKDLLFRLGEARNKLISALSSNDEPKMGFLSAIYATLMFDSIFALVDKPLAPPSVGWRWLPKLPGLQQSGIEKIQELFTLPLHQRVRRMAELFGEMHGQIARKKNYVT